MNTRQLSVIFLSLTILSACGGGSGGGSDGGGGAESGSTGSSGSRTFQINTPSYQGRYETLDSTVDLGGSLSVPSGSSCTAGIVRLGSSVSWRNSANNASGRGTSSMWCVGIVAATWSAPGIPLQIGDNRISVSGSGGSDSIVVTRLRDETPPSLTWVTPRADATDVSVNTTINVNFDEAVKTTTVHSNSLFLTDAGGNRVDGYITLDYYGDSAQLKPLSGLNYSETYTAHLTGEIEDERGGNPRNRDFVWQFTTGENPDHEPPEVSSTTPAQGSTCAAPDSRVSANFNESLDPASVSPATLRVSGEDGIPVPGSIDHQDTTVSFVADDPLVPGAAYRADVGGLKDLAGNEMLFGESWSFSIEHGDGVGAWRATDESTAPIARENHVAVWTGDRMFVWSGTNHYNGQASRTGALYDPATDTWTPVSPVDQPHGRQNATAVWTGQEVIVWGGGNAASEGGAYDPIADQWRIISTHLTLWGRSSHSAVWTGSEMIVWGGKTSFGEAQGDGAAYNPTTDSWRSLAETGAPTPRANHSAVWTGQEMIVWGGHGEENVTAGAAYDPLTDTWRELSAEGAPHPGGLYRAVWTGTEMLLHNGFNSRRYDPPNDVWTAMNRACAPAHDWYNGDDDLAVWTGRYMMLWSRSQGGLYDPVTDSWDNVPAFGIPEERVQASLVSTGNGAILWGGGDRIHITVSFATGAVLTF